MTHKHIVREASGVFNRFGYGATPVSAIMTATGMKKGGLYNQFLSKEELAVESFRFNVATVADFLRATFESTDDPMERLRRLLRASLLIAEGRVVPGGCPVLNAAIESDDAIPVMRKEAARSARKVRTFIRSQIDAARDAGLLRRDADSGKLSYFFLASLEGGIMLAKLHGIPDPLEAVIYNLNAIIDTLATDGTGSRKIQ